jgi:hypothetical protein
MYQFRQAALRDFDSRYLDDDVQRLLKISCFPDPRVREFHFIADEAERSDAFEYAKLHVRAELTRIAQSRKGGRPATDGITA